MLTPPQIDDLAQMPLAERGIFCNRTLNMRSIRAIGFDMDYTLVDYYVDAWEERAFGYMQRELSAKGYPVDDVKFDPDFVTRGLVIDTQHGNVVKANRFGYVKRAMHGTAPLPFEEQRARYSRTLVDLAERRWVFLNTLFSLSEACMYAHLVDRLDAGQLSAHSTPDGPLGYAELYQVVRRSLDAAHAEGQLKADIVADPARYVRLDPDVTDTLRDLRDADKRLLLITNSEWSFTQSMMSYNFDRYLPKGQTWRDLFDIVIVSARKPDFFSATMPAFEVVDESSGLLQATSRALEVGKAYVGGHASQIERCLGVSGDEVLYIGDHIYGDVHVSKSLLRWRTALIVSELEREVADLKVRTRERTAIEAGMRKKEALEHYQCRIRLELLRAKHQRAGSMGVADLQEALAKVRRQLEELDLQIAPLAKAEAQVFNRSWGPTMRAGKDKSLFARQVERSADIYTSRVSNFLLYTPYFFFRSPQGSLPHDPLF